MCNGESKPVINSIDGVQIHQFQGAEAYSSISSLSVHPKRPILADFKQENLKEVVPNLFVIMVCENEDEKGACGPNRWIRRGEGEFGISSIIYAKDRFSVANALESVHSQQWVLFVSPSTYIFLTNVLMLMKVVDNKGDETAQYFGFPFWDSYLEYNDLSAGILLNPGSVRVVKSQVWSLKNCENRGFDKCLGGALRCSGVGISKVRGFEPEPAENVLRFYDRGYGKSHYVRKYDPLENIYPPLSFGRNPVANTYTASKAAGGGKDDDGGVFGESIGVIPGRIHQVFVGGSVVPGKYSALMEGCKNTFEGSYNFHHFDPFEGPDILRNTVARFREIRTEREESSKSNELELDGRGLFIEESNVLRWEVLWKYGGVYIDNDFLCVNNIEDRDRPRMLLQSTLNVARRANSDLILGCECDRASASGVNGLVDNSFIAAPRHSLSVYFFMQLLIHTAVHPQCVQIPTPWQRSGKGLLQLGLSYFQFPAWIMDSTFVHNVHWSREDIGFRVNRNSKLYRGFLQESAENEDVWGVHLWDDLLETYLSVIEKQIEEGQYF